MLFRTFLVVAAFACAGEACADDLQGIIGDARANRIDVCRDTRWPMWRFDEGAAGFARVKALRQRADDARTQTSLETTTGAAEAARLAALRSMLDAVIEARSRQGLRASFTQSETRYLNWRQRAAALARDLPGLLRARAVWRLARARNIELIPRDPVAAGVFGCLIPVDHAAAEGHVVDRLVELLDAGHFPTDAVDGAGASTAMIAFPESQRARRYLVDNWTRVSAMAPEGLRTLWRLSADLHQDPAGSSAAFVERFEEEWELIACMLASLSPPSSVGEELYRRTRAEQYGRNMMAALAAFPAGPLRQQAFSAVWKRISAVDVDNTARAKTLLRTRDWFDDERDGDGAEFFGWLIVQHSDLEPGFQREVLNRMEKLLPSGRARRRNFAYLWDRVAIAEGRPQRYGTQYTCRDGRWALSPTEDLPKLDARRKEMGLEPARLTLDGAC
jgi:hypothetical protein